MLVSKSKFGSTFFLRFTLRSFSSAPNEPADETLKPDTRSNDSKRSAFQKMSSILSGDRSSSEVTLGKIVRIPWDKSISPDELKHRREEIAREWKQKWVRHRVVQYPRYNRLIDLCAEKLGNDATMDIVAKMEKETGMQGYNVLIERCIKKARASKDEDFIVNEIHKVYQIFSSMRKHGFELEEESYGKFLKFLIDKKMIEDFLFFGEFIHNESPRSLPRLAHYEMLLWVKLDDEDKIKGICHSFPANDDDINNSRNGGL